jgi:amidase
MSPSKDWQSIAAEKRADAFKRIPKAWRLPSAMLAKYNASTPRNVLSIPRDCGILSEQEVEITGQYDAVTLAEKLAKRDFTAVAVTTAFSKRAAIAQQLV